MLISPLYIPDSYIHIKFTSNNFFYIAAKPHHIFDAVKRSVNVARSCAMLNLVQSKRLERSLERNASERATYDVSLFLCLE